VLIRFRKTLDGVSDRKDLSRRNEEESFETELTSAWLVEGPGDAMLSVRDGRV
jgi:hypothetical protein